MILGVVDWASFDFNFGYILHSVCFDVFATCCLTMIDDFTFFIINQLVVKEDARYKIGKFIFSLYWPNILTYELFIIKVTKKETIFALKLRIIPVV